MIQKLTTKLIPQLLDGEEKIKEIMGCERGEWVQLLMANADNPAWFMLCNVTEENRVHGYLIAADNVHPPLSKNAIILLFVTSGEFLMNNEMKKQLDIWAKKRGANAIFYQCKNADIFKKYGGEKIAELGGWEL